MRKDRKMAEFPEYQLEKPGPRFTSLLTTNQEDVPKRNSHLEAVQSELELLLLSASVRLRSLTSESKLLVDPEIDTNIKKHRAAKRFVPKRRQSKILEAAIEAKRKRAEAPAPLPLPPKPIESDEFWSMMLRGLSGPIQPEAKKSITDILDAQFDKTVFQRPPRQSNRRKNRDSSAEEANLQKKLLDACKTGLKEQGVEVKIEMPENLKDRLTKAGVYIDDENEVLTELTIAQEELRQLVTENKEHATILYRLSRNHEKSQRNKQKLFEVDKEIMEMMVNEKYESEEFEAKMKLREKYEKNLEKYEKIREQWLGDDEETESDDSSGNELDRRDGLELETETSETAETIESKPSTSKAEPTA
ncbi:Oidioi.mRNA.OKI2018_I69.chr1.g3178.t1.cds [Oikopleura dioica]|uniref:Oidioi.mRNA.OKI2018_I69.chr1.g3178.t1.cds n=1 Tax=Oikopleura dioica TaxID=34765 RepID=A0ABN7STD8_OIKDI|nr:Oidioi.mRNA.OKI2018_I69.chr1.g3178.t1.cds [Oikopleura dioica]